mgnify:CR=1 FL=1
MHKTVLLQEAIDGLNLDDGRTVVDATFGGGGHSAEICRKFPKIKIIALDQDNGVWERARGKLENCNISFHNANFRDLDKVLEKDSLSRNIDGIIFDLGLSSDQLEDSGRGFSFMKDEPLIMTMKENPRREDITAEDVVNTWSEESLADIIYGYGEERLARKIARAIVEARREKEIKTSFDLVKIIKSAVPAVYQRGRIHFATRTFQAIRIAVNDELSTLSEGLDKGFRFLKNGGRLSVITFHSLEDRIVKKFFKNKEKNGEARIINKKVILPSTEEIKNNTRSRSAKLRILEKITALAG